MFANPRAARTVGLIVAILVSFGMALFRGDSLSAPAATRGSTLYDPDPQHLWNRLHDALRVRLTTNRADEEFLVEAENEEENANDLDPMLWHPSKYLFTGPADAHYDALVRKAPHLREFPRKSRDAHREALAVLDEFLSKDGEKLLRDPLRRALLQRDLWALFDTLADPAFPLLDSSRFTPARRPLLARLAKLLPRLALSGEQIRQLPDNFAAAVKAGTVPAAFDPERPKAAFLPRDLWQVDGPWVLVGAASEGPLASTHARFFGGRSAFLVFLCLPGGRRQTLDYVNQLLDDADKRVQANPSLPPRTQVALVRRTMLLDERGEIVPTPLTETMQVRVYLDPKQQITQPDGGDVQTFIEHRLRRRDLLAGKAGGLTPAGAQERERAYVLFYGLGGGDEREVIGTSCRGCHGRPGIESVNSYVGDFRRGRKTPLRATTLTQEERVTVQWKKAQYTWGLLEGLQAKPTQ